VSEWWTYRIRSFVLFSARTYERLIEAYNAELWPLQPALLLVALVLLVWLARRHSVLRDRLLLGALAAAWCTVAWAFEHRRFASVNWAADYVAGVYALQALALGWAALRAAPALRNTAHALDHLGLAIAALALAAWPLFTVSLGGAWSRAEIVGLMPAPTALASLGVLLLAKPLRPWLLVVPLAACAFEGALLWALYAGRG